MRSHLGIIALAVGLPAAAQDARTWLESQGLEAGEPKSFQEFEAMVARVKGAKDATEAQERIVVFRQGKLLWQSTPKDLEPASRLKLHAFGKDLDGDGQPDMHVSSFSGGAHCCTTHAVYRIKPQVKRHATFAANNVAAVDFVEVPDRKVPVLLSADDTSANKFSDYASSYFPVLVLEVSPKGKFQLAPDLMRAKLPGQPPPVCMTPMGASNPWLKERCAEFSGTRRNARTKEIQAKLQQVKAGRSADRMKWEDYHGSGVLATVAAELNRYAYTGHPGAGMNWLEGIWPGNDAVKVKFLATLRETWTKTAFAADLKALGADTR